MNILATSHLPSVQNMTADAHAPCSIRSRPVDLEFGYYPGSGLKVSLQESRKQSAVRQCSCKEGSTPALLMRMSMGCLSCCTRCRVAAANCLTLAKSPKSKRLHSQLPGSCLCSSSSLASWQLPLPHALLGPVPRAMCDLDGKRVRMILHPLITRCMSRCMSKTHGSSTI